MSAPKDWFEIEDAPPTPPAGIDAVRGLVTAKKSATKAPPPTPPTPVGRGLSHYQDEVKRATSAEAAALVVDEARDVLDAADCELLGQAYVNRWEK
jgi:hypothetical protein